MKITVVGGGSTYTPELIEGILKIENELQIEEVVLLDIDESREKLDILTDFSKRILESNSSKIKISGTLNSIKAFKNCDFVINQFRAGGLKGRIKDEKIPLKYDLIGQETTGIGGMANGIRALSIIEKYTREIRQYGNNPWIINFSNPSGMLTEYLVNYLKYPKAIGVCNVPIEFIFHLQKIFDCSRDDLFLKYYGLNHLTWIDGIKVNGVERAKELYNNFRVNMKNIPDLDYGDEFIPEMKTLFNSYLKYFYNSKGMLNSLKGEAKNEGTRGEQIEKIEETLLKKYSEPDRVTPPEELNLRGGFMYSTVAVELIRDIYRGDSKVHIVNSRNNGALKDLPDDYIVEVPVKITSCGPEKIDLGETSLMSRGLIHTIKSYEKLVIEGYIKRDESLIKQAMLLHPLGPDEVDLNRVWEDIKKGNRKFFPVFSH